MKAVNAIAVSFALASFALLGTWASTTGEVRTTGALNAGDLDSCPVTDKTGGWGGQDVGCAFPCQYPGMGSLNVNANDGDATVSGSGTCDGIGFLSCTSETNSCDDQARVPAGGAGVCSGSSSEFYDSGLTVSCSTELEELGGDPVFEQWCPVEVQPYFTLCLNTPPPLLCESDGTCPEPVHVCVTLECETDDAASGRSASMPVSLCFIAYGTNGKSLCQATLPWDEKVRIAASLARALYGNITAPLDDSSAHLAMVDGAAMGLVCWERGCAQHFPTCWDYAVAGGAKCDLK